MKSLRILLADDSHEVRQSVRGLLEHSGFQIVGEAADGQEAVRLAQTLQPDVAVLDLCMPHLDGVGAAQKINEACRDTSVILLTFCAEPHNVVRAVSAGIPGYVVKSDAGKDLVPAINQVSRGGTFLSTTAFRVVDGRFCPGPRPEFSTRRPKP